MDFKEKTVGKNYVYKGRIVNLRNDEVLLPDGKNARREIIEHSGGSTVLCYENGKVLMVKQFRYAYGEEIWEIPAGKLNPGEDPLETARRELEEEGGVYAKDLELIFTVYPTPGYTEEIIRIYSAKNLTKTKQHLDEDEFLNAEWIELSKLKQMVENGEIKDGKTLIALLWLFSKEKIN